MKRPLRPARESRPGYPALSAARRILCGAALAGGLLVAAGAQADTTLPPTGNRDGNRPVVIRPGGKPALPRPVVQTKGDQPRPQPPKLGGEPPRVQPTEKAQ